MQDVVIPAPPSGAVGSFQRKLGPTEMEIDYYLNDANSGVGSTAAQAQKFKAVTAATRQRTSENRLHELHLSTYPKPLNAKTIQNVDPPVFPQLTNANATTSSSLLGTRASVTKSGKSYPPHRSTNQVFNAVVEASKASIRKRVSPEMHDPLLDFATRYNQGWSDMEKADVRAARSLPYDSTISSVVGSPRTVYRHDYCRTATDRDFRTQWSGFAADGLVPSEETQHSTRCNGTILSPRQLTKQVLASSKEQTSPRVALRTVVVGENSQDSAAQAPPSFSLLGSTNGSQSETTPRAGSARVQRHAAEAIPKRPVASASSSRSRQLEVYPPTSASPRRLLQTFGTQPEEQGQYSTFSLSYFANRSKYTNVGKA